jgi:threonine synthase
MSEDQDHGRITCTNCRRPYPAIGLPYRCPACGGLFDFSQPWSWDDSRVDPSQPGIWRYRFSLGLPEGVEAVSLGEGRTPLVWARVFGRRVGFKCEFLNPTASFKDRGSVLIAAWLRARRVDAAVEDSSGNAGASLAAYLSRCGIPLRVFIPAQASGPKRAQIEALGGQLVPIAGTRTEVAEAVEVEARRGATYASHAFLPFNLPGYATAAYEIAEDLGGELPAAVILPVGQGGFLLGLWRGFQAIRVAYAKQGFPAGTGREAAPRMIGVQARACAPLWTLEQGGPAALGFVAENPTLAEGVRVFHPLRAGSVLEAIHTSGGSICAVEESEILPGRDALARLGFYVEPTSAIVWTALAQTLATFPDPVVVVLTGSGYKYRE